MSIKNRVPKFRSLTRLKLSFALATDSLLPNEIAFCKGYYKTVFIKDLSMNSFRGVGGEGTAGGCGGGKLLAFRFFLGRCLPHLACSTGFSAHLPCCPLLLLKG